MSARPIARYAAFEISAPVISPVHTLFELTDRGDALARDLWPDQSSPRRTEG